MPPESGASFSFFAGVDDGWSRGGRGDVLAAVVVLDFLPLAAAVDFESGLAEFGGGPATVYRSFDGGEFGGGGGAFGGLCFGDFRRGEGAFVLRGDDGVDETESGIERGLGGGANGGGIESSGGHVRTFRRRRAAHTQTDAWRCC